MCHEKVLAFLFCAVGFVAFYRALKLTVVSRRRKEHAIHVDLLLSLGCLFRFISFLLVGHDQVIINSPSPPQSRVIKAAESTAKLSFSMAGSLCFMAVFIIVITSWVNTLHRVYGMQRVCWLSGGALLTALMALYLFEFVCVFLLLNGLKTPGSIVIASQLAICVFGCIYLAVFPFLFQQMYQLVLDLDGTDNWKVARVKQLAITIVIFFAIRILGSCVRATWQLNSTHFEQNHGQMDHIMLSLYWAELIDLSYFVLVLRSLPRRQNTLHVRLIDGTKTYGSMLASPMDV